MSKKQKQIARALHFKHGEAPSRNGKAASPEYRAWRAMIDRCEHPQPKDAKYYRGIKVCRRWRHNFLAFLVDMGRKPSPNLTLDRINGNRGYNPRNCRWATPKQQNENQRPRTARTICMKGLHPLTPSNTIQRADGDRRCRACWQSWYQSRKA